ncbi:flagellin [uncultured Campylobacter sp.]|uniref:flagellin N-terminal helical domain-containing protein n=1 Tax=uncultured Campylobacter sp. TaxID=218934 RepID=UPI002633579B|nr:flagellin [uncultured Campylobacter sp.]
MGLRINTNIGALNAHNNMLINSRGLDSSLEKLSSGLRINSAKDDASGMAIADQLRSQASTLGQAINNGNDAMSILQVADKAMDEQLKILDTIKTKATQAAQDGQSTKTRNMLQADINRLMEELDNIANTTSFNGKQLLSGGFINQEFQIGVSSNQTIKASIGSTQTSKIGLTRFETGQNVLQSGEVNMVLRNYDGVNDFNFPRVTISTSVGTGLGALAEEINRVADLTGVRASFNVQTMGSTPIRQGVTSEDFSINGVIIGKIEYRDNDSNNALVAAINSKKDTTGVEAARDANGHLLLTSIDGRGIKITGSVGAGAGIPINMLENYGRLSLVKNNGGDISVEGLGFGFDDDKLVSQASVSLRETKGKLSQKLADAMGFNSFEKIATITVGVSSISILQGTGLSTYTQLVYGAGSGLSTFVTTAASNAGYNIDIGPGLGVLSNMSLAAAGTGFSSLADIISVVKFSAVYDVALNAVSTYNGELLIATAAANGLSTISLLGVERLEERKMQIGLEQTAGVTTLQGAMSVMDVAETAIINLDQVRADIGSVQNQLQVTINNISVTQVNLKSAESTIRDVDFAAESANFSKHNILAQSGSYALAQANASQQHVLQLLQ